MQNALYDRVHVPVQGKEGAESQQTQRDEQEGRRKRGIGRAGDASEGTPDASPAPHAARHRWNPAGT